MGLLKFLGYIFFFLIGLFLLHVCLLKFVLDLEKGLVWYGAVCAAPSSAGSGAADEPGAKANQGLTGPAGRCAADWPVFERGACFTVQCWSG